MRRWHAEMAERPKERYTLTHTVELGEERTQA